MKCCMVLALIALWALTARPASAPAPDVVFAGVDENGLGGAGFTTGGIPVLLALFPASMAADPGPGGLSSVLTYDTSGSPFVPGDVLLTDADAGGAVQDVIRFNPGGFVVFYSDNSDGSDSLADVGLPTALYANQKTVPETGTEGINGALYMPGPNDPGFIPFIPFPQSFVFVSDGSLANVPPFSSLLVPEPGSAAFLLVTGLGGTVLLVRRRRK